METAGNTYQGEKSWGRAWEAGTVSFLGSLGIILTTPFMVLYFYLACDQYGGSLSAPLQGIYAGTVTWEKLWGQLPGLSTAAIALYAVWFLLQLICFYLPDVLHRIVPDYQGGECLGSVTPAGNQLQYNINGLQAWVISHGLFFLGAFYYGWFSPTVIVDLWGPMLWVTTLFGNLVALFAYVKAHLFPSHPEDRKFSGNFVYDYYMGIELNPRIGRFDFKLFFNGRPGIVLWTLLNISFAAKQYELYGYVTNSMLIVNFLQALYVLYFFWNERWYLHTIDICHDHFGWMLAWGDCTWLPYMYTLQGLYLVYVPVELSTPYALFVLSLGLLGYAIFHSANRQKDRFRKEGEERPIWGKRPEVVHCDYLAQDGKVRKSTLLASGWWGMARHFNYTGDLIGCSAYSLACGYGHILPYFYVIFLTILLVHRCRRDEHRCKNKYGSAWDEYCRKVPWRMIPGIY